MRIGLRGHSSESGHSIEWDHVPERMIVPRLGGYSTVYERDDSIWTYEDRIDSPQGWKVVIRILPTGYDAVYNPIGFIYEPWFHGERMNEMAQ